MQKNILVDLNVILDYVLDRPDAGDLQPLINDYEAGINKLYVSAHAVTTFAYLLENVKQNHSQIEKWTEWLLHNFNVVAVNDEILKAALKSQIKDYEDAVVEQAALGCEAKFIITRNLKDFKHSRISALSPRQYISELA